MARVLKFPSGQAREPDDDRPESVGRPEARKRGDAARRAQGARRIIRLAYGIDAKDSRVVLHELIGDDVAVVRLLDEPSGPMTVLVARAAGRKAQPLPDDCRDDLRGRAAIRHIESLHKKYGRSASG